MLALGLLHELVDVVDFFLALEVHALVLVVVDEDVLDEIEEVLDGLLGEYFLDENVATEDDGTEGWLLAFEGEVLYDYFFDILGDALKTVECLLDVLNYLDELVDLVAEQLAIFDLVS